MAKQRSHTASDQPHRLTTAGSATPSERTETPQKVAMNTASPKDISIADLAKLFMKHMPHGCDIGMQLMAPAPDGKSRMRLPPQPFLSGDPGATFFFPGVLFSMADSACGMAVFHALGHYVPIATLDMRIDHLAPATMDSDLVAVAECYRMTKSIAFARCELLSGPQSKVSAIAVGTFMLSSSSVRISDAASFLGGKP